MVIRNGEHSGMSSRVGSRRQPYRPAPAKREDGRIGDEEAAKPAQAVAESAGEPASLIPKAQATIDRIDLLLSKASP